jgi:hypothetical protein
LRGGWKYRPRRGVSKASTARHQCDPIAPIAMAGPNQAMTSKGGIHDGSFSFATIAGRYIAPNEASARRKA